MQLSKNTKEQISTQKALIFLVPIAIIVVITILFIFVIPSSYSEIISRIQSYKSNQQKEEVVSKKLTVLQNTSQDILNKAPQTVIVLPDKNPVLALVAQIKEAAITENVAITDVKSDSVSEIEDGILKADFKIGLEAESFTQIAKVLDELAKKAPISSISLAEIRSETTVKHANLQISAYWADLPTNLPGIEEALDPFSPEELAVLDQISKLTAPQFNVLTPEGESLRENPFN